MRNYDDLVGRLRKGTKIPPLARLMNEAADAIEWLSYRVRLQEIMIGIDDIVIDAAKKELGVKDD